MAKLLALLITLTVTASLRALSVMWSVPPLDHLTWMSGTGVAYQFVYTEGSTDASYWNAGNAKAVANSAKTPVEGFTTATDQEWQYGTQGESSYAAATFQSSFDGDGNTVINENAYYYLVVFKAETNDYAVIGGLNRYTKDGTTTRNGIYDTAVDGNAPEFGTYLDLSTIASSGFVVATPEPTVFALLALGVAGLALRRKNF